MPRPGRIQARNTEKKVGMAAVEKVMNGLRVVVRTAIGNARRGGRLSGSLRRRMESVDGFHSAVADSVAGYLGADVGEEPVDGEIVGKGEGLPAKDAGCPREAGECAQEGKAAAAMLVFIDEDDGDLGELGVRLRADAAGDADLVDLTAVGVEDGEEERDVIREVAVGEVVEFGLGEAAAVVEKAVGVALRGKAGKAAGEGGTVRRRDGADERGRAVGEVNREWVRHW